MPPDLADDTDATIRKRPICGSGSIAERDDQGSGTAAGLAAIEELTRRGVNVNVTLLFSIERYQQVIDAYLRGLSARAQAGEPMDRIHSVASFFLSRIDTKVDDQLAEGSPLRGQIAIASARVAYRRYLTKFSGKEWERLQQLGANRQRPLWASTGAKNPDYADTRYVAELIGPDVVNTMPDHTLHLFADHGEVVRTLDADPEAAERTLAEASAAGIDLQAVTPSSSAKACARSVTPTASCSTASRASWAWSPDPSPSPVRPIRTRQTSEPSSK